MPSHSYATRFPSVNYSGLGTRLPGDRFRISMGGLAIWNNFVANADKKLESSSLFKTKVKNKLLDFENELVFF